MKSRDFAKLAMMGVIGGCLMGSSSASAAGANDSAQNNNQGVILAHACGNGACGAKRGYQGSRSYVADNDDSNSRPDRGGCNGRAKPLGYQEGHGCNVGACGAKRGYQVADNEGNSGCASHKSSRGYQGYNVADNDMDQASQNDVTNGMSAESKATYQSLSPEGKAMVMKLISSGQAKNKDRAVQMAAEKMNEKGSMMNQNNPSYNQGSSRGY